MLCDSCDAVFINGHKCHEHGCPDAWKEYKRKCPCCDKMFKPKEKNQICCTKRCTKEYYR